MDMSAEIILLTDRSTLKLVDANDMAYRVLGYSREELLSMGMNDLVPQSRESLEQICDRLVAGGGVDSRVRNDYRKKDGSTTPVEATQRALRSGSSWIIVSVARDITEQLAAETALRNSIERFDRVVRATNDVIWDWDLLTGEVVHNANASLEFGYPECNATASTWRERIHPQDRERVLQSIHAAIDAGREDWSEEYRLRRRDGSYAHIFDRGHVIRAPSGQALRMIGAMADITARKEAEQRAAEQALRQRLIAEFGHSALAATDIALTMEEAASLVTKALRAEYSEVLELDEDKRSLILRAVRGWPGRWQDRAVIAVEPGSHAARVLAGTDPVIMEDFAAETRFTAAAMPRGAVRSGIEVPISGKGGSYGVLAVHTAGKRRFARDDVDFMQTVSNILAVAIERRHAEMRLAQLAQFDALTGLPNRQLFNDRLAQTVAQAARSGRPMAVLFIDLDRFKQVNDTLGHATGDRLLQCCAERLMECVRGGDTVGRLGGDEFAAILNDLTRPGDAAVVAQKIIDALALPFQLGSHEAYVSASVGITRFPEDGADPGALITNADAAMYRAKEQGRNNYQYYTREMNERALERMQLEVLLRRALERKEWVLHYQPKVSLATGAISGAEALLRWRHPEKGLLAPADFISLLEDTGMIAAAGQWVINEVCRQIAAWESQGLIVPPVAVNLSGRQFQQKDLEGAVGRVLAAHRVHPSLLQFELTESLLMHDPEGAARTLQGLKRAGVRLSVDGFGTGYSSLSYLKRFPLDALNIDRAFVRDISTDPDDARIARAIIGLAHSLELAVVAEGVETEAQLNFLAAHACDEIQGHCFSPPVPAEGFAAMLRSGRRLESLGVLSDPQAPLFEKPALNLLRGL